MTHEEFTKKVFDVFTDSDYSRFPDLRDLTRGEIFAISRLLHDYDVEPTEENCLRAARHRYALYGDESALANGEFREFIDAADDMGFTSGRLEQIIQWTAEKAREKFSKDGFYFIDLTKPAEDAAFYIFRPGAIGE